MRARNIPIRLGEIVDGKYRVQDVLGEGGMGVVFRAKHQQLGRMVAIKLLLPDMLEDPSIMQRFEREARATARLKNEHVIDVLDVGRLPTGEPYMVMEYLEGKDLSKYLASRGRLDVDETIDVVLQICEGVAEAHSNGIVHRDLKPQNVFLTTRRDGRPLAKVLDFGISKVSGDIDGGLTGTRDMLGSPNYMSPEQLLSTKDAGPSADIWALGVILYQLLAGRLPFEGETLAAITLQICNAVPVPLSRVRDDVPLWLADLVTHCLAKDPAERFASVDTLAAALRARAYHAPSSAVPTTSGMSSPSVLHVGTPVMRMTPMTPMPAHGATAPLTPTPRGARAKASPGAITSSTWGHTKFNSAPTSSRAVLVTAVLLMVVLAGGGLIGAREYKRRAPPLVVAAATPAPAIPSATTSATPGGAPTLSGEPLTTPAAVPSGAKSNAGTPPAKPRVVAPTPAAPGKVPSATPTNEDELPSIRK